MGLLVDFMESELRLKDPRPIHLLHHNDGPTTQLDGDFRRTGKGLVVLLHGLHGVGKTLVAETTAESVEMPIIPLTAADFTNNADPSTVEGHITKLFRLASKWGVMLLFDNADRFLVLGTTSNVIGITYELQLIYNCLDDFTGMLFLTTTEFAVLPPVLVPHISLVQPLDAPDYPARLKLWELYLSGTPATEWDTTLDAAAAQQLAAKTNKLTGREIAQAVERAMKLRRAGAAKDPDD
ncbi:P-loop containing nucleoside triphosphate hydrolase protein [Immersiella caudata]|uniref:P-loop containing nucleoside triphosphate hydrolase protein n=1 Tax=Immersiella caudata TaxID=314043 RepID=A0AA39WA67_9PEZI|nr:P-loop containing nucleoside triphosphate hydrolase protein [Immersiella caudata]